MFKLNAIAHQLLLPLLLSLGVASMLSACSEDDNEIPDNDNNGINRSVDVVFKLDTGSLNVVSSSIEDVNGLPEENYIDLSNLKLYITDNGTYGGWLKSELKPQHVYQIDDHTYQIEGSIQQFPTGTFKIAVYANWPKNFVTNSSVLYSVISENGSYDYKYGSDPLYYIPSTTNPIPMFGINVYSGDDYQGKNYVDLGTINLFRAMSKIIVKSSYGDTLNSVTLSRCNNKGMCAPVFMYSQIDEITSTYLNIPREQSSSCSQASNIDNIPFRDLGDNTFLIYVPEYRNVASGSHTATPTHMTVTLNDVAYDISFSDPPSSTNYFDLLRNHMYIYDISISNLSYAVMDWSTYTSGDINFN